MPSILDIPTIIEIGDVSVYRMANYQSQQQLFGGSKVLRSSPFELALLTDALRWGYNGGAQTSKTLRNIGNYNYWLYGKFGLEAQNIISGPGGGSLVPTPTVDASEFPIYVTNTDFSTSVDYNDTRIIGKSLLVFDNEIPKYLLPGVDFSYTLTGIQILVPGFNATTQTVNMVIEKVTSAQPSGGSGSLLLGSYYYGNVDYYSDLIANNDDVPYVANFSSTLGSPMSVLFPLAASDPGGKFLVFRIPNTQTDKTTWANTGTLNSGTIPDIVFREQISFGGYDYYCTRIAYVFDPAFLTIVLT